MALELPLPPYVLIATTGLHEIKLEVSPRRLHDVNITISELNLRTIDCVVAILQPLRWMQISDDRVPGSAEIRDNQEILAKGLRNAAELTCTFKN